MFSAASKRHREDDGDGEVTGAQRYERKVCDCTEVQSRAMLTLLQKIRSLPIRSSAPSQRTAVATPAQPGLCTLPTLLTPGESSDGDLPGGFSDTFLSPLPALDESITSSDSSASSVKVIVDDEHDTDMVDAQLPGPMSSPLPWQRSRSNDMLAPPQMSRILGSQASFGAERATLPFEVQRDGSDWPVRGPGQSTRATLQPMIRPEDQPNWHQRLRVTSASNEAVATRTQVGPAGGMMDRHHVSSNALGPPMSHHGMPAPDPGVDMTGFHEGMVASHRCDDPRRPWRVTMGYRADCEKCIQKIPGHYSHIVSD